MAESGTKPVADLVRLEGLATHPSVEAAVNAAREVLGMDVAYSTHLTDTHQVFQLLRGDGESFGLGEGLEMPLEMTYCKEILAGRLPNLIPDVHADPHAGHMPVTETAGVGAFASVPLVFSSGRCYGTLCCASHDAKPTLGERDLGFLRVLGRLIADQLEREELQRGLRVLERRALSADALVKAIEARDAYTGAHSRAVLDLALAVGVELGLDSEQLAEVELVALLHDVGKLSVPDAILHKPGPLTEAEWKVMRRHPIDGAELAESVERIALLAPAIRAEHERWDGVGYPDGLAGEEIPIVSRVTSVCDAFDAMTSDRPYRSALSAEAAIAEIETGAGSQFCPQCAAALLEVVRRMSGGKL